MPCIRYIIHIHSGFQPSAEGVALFSQRFASLHIGLNYYALSGLFFNCSLSERAESPVYFSPIPQGWGIDSHTPSGGLKA